MTIDPYKPVPWETFTLVDTRARRSRFLPVFVTLAILVMVIGTLFASNN